MMCFNTIFGDTPSSVYGIYVVLYVTYGRTYVKVTYDDGLLFSRGASGEAIFGEDWWAYRVTWDVTVSPHGLLKPTPVADNVIFMF